MSNEILRIVSQISSFECSIGSSLYTATMKEKLVLYNRFPIW